MEAIVYLSLGYSPILAGAYSVMQGVQTNHTNHEK